MISWIIKQLREALPAFAAGSAFSVDQHFCLLFLKRLLACARKVCPWGAVFGRDG